MYCDSNYSHELFCGGNALSRLTVNAKPLITTFLVITFQAKHMQNVQNSTVSATTEINSLQLLCLHFSLQLIHSFFLCINCRGIIVLKPGITGMRMATGQFSTRTILVFPSFSNPQNPHEILSLHSKIIVTPLSIYSYVSL